jgi:hypothetical protein
MVQCPDCGCQFRDVGGVTHSTTTAKTRRLWQKRQSYVPYYQQVQSLAPGEALWRPLETVPDIAVPLRYSAVGSSLVTGMLYFGFSFVRSAGAFPAILANVQTETIIQAGGGFFLAGTAVLFFVLTRRVLSLDDAHFKVKLRESIEEPEPQEPDTQPISLAPRKKRNSPTSHSTRLPQIPTPAAGREWLARWFARIVGRDGVGFSQGVAEKYRISRQECKAVQDVFVGEGWAERKSRKGGLAAVTLNDDGLDAMREVVESYYPGARV